MSPLRLHALGGCLALAALATLHNFPHLAPGAYNWAEPGNVATALLQGRGFSDPFGGGTGATAWVPPLPVGLLAVVFLFAGIKSHAAAVVLLLAAVAGLSVAHALVLKIAGRLGARARWGASLCFILTLALLPNGPLEVQSEAWLDILISAALLDRLLAYRAAPALASACGLGALGAVAALTHAGLALASLLCLALLFVTDLGSSRFPLRPLLALSIVAVALGGWTARNALALGKLIPLKSNFWFECYLANVASPDGFPRAETTLRLMPYFNQQQFDRYKTLGEAGYVESFKAPTVAALGKNPAAFAGSVWRRFLNAATFCKLGDGSASTHAAFNPADRARLAGAGELITVDGSSREAIWLRIDEPATEAAATMSRLGLSEPERVWSDWTQKHALYLADRMRLREIASGLIVAAVPVLALLVSLLMGNGVIPDEALWAAVMAAATVAPFVAINHSMRHQLPLLAFGSIIVGIAVELLWRRAMTGGTRP